MASRRLTIRVPESIHRLLETEADHDGVSVSRFILHSALLRIGFRMAQRGDYVDDADRVALSLHEALKRDKH